MLYSSDVGTLRSPMDARKLSEPRLTMESVQSIMFALVLISKSNRRMTTGDTFFAGLVAAAARDGLKETDVSRFPPFFVRPRLMVSFFLEMIAMRRQDFPHQAGW